MTVYAIYVLKDPSSEIRYVGSTHDVAARWQMHRCGYRKPDICTTPLYRTAGDMTGWTMDVLFSIETDDRDVALVCENGIMELMRHGHARLGGYDGHYAR